MSALETFATAAVAAMPSLIADNLVVLPIAIPLLMGSLMILLRSRPKIQKIVDIIVSVVVLCLSAVLWLTVFSGGPIAYDVGEFGKYGIMLVGDMLSATMVLLTSFISTVVLVYSYDYIETSSLNKSYHALFNLMIAGINGIFLTGDLFNLFVFFEIMFLSSSALIMANEKVSVTKLTHKLEGTYKYMILGMLGSFFMLIAIVTTYASIGSLNMADIAYKIGILAESGQLPWPLLAAALLFIIVFGNKAALVPLHFWLPDVHPTAPTPVSAMLSGILIKVGVYGILRVMFLIYAPASGLFLPVLLLCSLLTMAVGAVGAIGQTDLKRILAYSSVSQIGFVLFGLAVGTKEAIAAAVLYLVCHAAAKSMLFLAAGGIIHETGTRDIRKMGGLIKTMPLLSFCFLLGAMSIAGFPPLGGFVAKMMLFQAGVSAGAYLPVMIAVVCAIGTLFYMFRTWMAVFWGESNAASGSSEKTAPSHKPHMSVEIVLPILVLCAAAVLLGIFAEPLAQAAGTIADQIMDPELYISTVLGVVPR